MDRRRHRTVVMLVALVALLVAPSAASAYSLGGARWPGTTIRYHESFPPSWDYALGRAVQSWNASGANIRFVRVSRPANAQLRMYIHPNPSGSGGDATLGYDRRSQLRIRGNPRRPAFVARGNSGPLAQLIAHELGHVLGLNHVARRCSIMLPNMPTDDCGYLQPWGMRCRLWSRDDQLGVLRRYGRARTRPRVPTTCYHGPATPTPSNVQVVGGGDTGAPATISWTGPSGTWTNLELRVRPAGRCDSTSGEDNIDTVALDPSARSWTDERAALRPLGTGICVTIDARGRYDRPAPLVRRTITYSTWPVQPPTIGTLAEWPDAYRDYDAPVATASDSHDVVVRTAPAAACPATPQEGEAVSSQVSFDQPRSIALFGVPAGEQCLSFFATMGEGWSVPVTRTANHVASPFPAP